MADESEIAITIVADEEANVQAAETPVKKTEDTAKVEVKDPAIQDLMAQYKELEAKSQENERRAQEAENRRLQAEQEAARHRDDADSARKAQTSSHLDTVTTAISAAQQEAESAKQAYKAARAAGDVDAEAEANDRWITAKADIRRLDEAKQDIEARIKAPPKREPPPADPVEAFAKNRTAPTAAWIRAHPEYVRSEKGLKKLTAADAIAQAEDLIPDTPEYFARVEEYLGIKKPASEVQIETKKAPTEASQVVPPKPRNSAPPVAPGASVSSNGAGGGMSVTLTAREAQAAQDGTIIWNWNDPSGKFKKGDPIGIQEMARRKIALQKSGAYDRSFTES